MDVVGWTGVRAVVECLSGCPPPFGRVKAPAVLASLISVLPQEAVLSVEKRKNNAIMPNSIEQNNLFLFLFVCFFFFCLNY